jgi:hypothetical protein
LTVIFKDFSNVKDITVISKDLFANKKIGEGGAACPLDPRLKHSEWQAMKF